MKEKYRNRSRQNAGTYSYVLEVACFSTLSAALIDFAGSVDAQHFQNSSVEPSTYPAAMRRRLSVCSSGVQMMG